MSMGAAGRARVEQELAWSHQARRYLGVYEHLVGTDPLGVSRPGREDVRIA